MSRKFVSGGEVRGGRFEVGEVHTRVGEGEIKREWERVSGRESDKHGGTNLCRNCPASRRPTINWCNCDSRPVGGRFSWWIRALGNPPLREQHCRRRRLPHRHPHRRPAASVPARFPICAETWSANTSLRSHHARTHTHTSRHTGRRRRRRRRRYRNQTAPVSGSSRVRSDWCVTTLFGGTIRTTSERTRREKKCHRRHHHHGHLHWAARCTRCCALNYYVN